MWMVTCVRYNISNNKVKKHSITLNELCFTKYYKNRYEKSGVCKRKCIEKIQGFKKLDFNLPFGKNPKQSHLHIKLIFILKETFITKLLF